jgi:hypothetical protein
MFLLRLAEVVLALLLAVVYLLRGEGLSGTELGEVWLLISMMAIGLKYTHFLFALMIKDCYPSKLLLSGGCLASGLPLFILSCTQPSPHPPSFQSSHLHRIVLWTGRSVWLSSAATLLAILVTVCVIRVLEWRRRMAFDYYEQDGVVEEEEY